MPLFASFSSNSARTLGLTSGAPPGPPTISSSSSTATTYTINFTPVLGSFEIARFEYSLNSGAFTGSISSASTSYTLTGLTPSTAYTVQIRAVDTAGQISDGSNVNSRSTTAEIAPSAPSVTVTQLESGSGTPINATRLRWSYGAASAGTYPVAYYQYRVRTSSSTILDWTTVPMGVGVNNDYTGLNPLTQYFFDVRGVATSNGTTYGSVGTGNATTDNEMTNDYPSVTITNQDTANVTFSYSGGSGGTYGISYYRYRIFNTSWGQTATGTLSTNNSSATVATGLSPDQFFYLLVDAYSATSGNVGVATQRDGRLNPGAPTVNTLSWSGSMNTGTTTAYLQMPAGSYNYSATLVIPGVGTYAGTNSGGTWVWSVGLSFNSSYSMYVYTNNRIGAQSGNTNTRYFTTPAKNQVFQVVPNGYSDRILAATNSSLDGCAASNESYTFGYVPPTDDSVGYVRITTIGIQIKSGGFSNTNTDYLYWAWPGGSTKSYGIYSQLNDNTDATYSLRYHSIDVGGSSLSYGTLNTTFEWVNGNPLGSAARIASGYYGCTPNGAMFFYVRGFYIEGVQTIAGSYS